MRTAKSGDKEAVALKALLQDKLLPQLNEAQPVRALTLDDNDWARVKTLHLLTTKPTMYIANVAEDGFEDYVTHRGEQGAKDAGRWRLEGKEYVVTDGDVIHFRFNV